MTHRGTEVVQGGLEEVLACTAWEEGAEEPAWDQEVEGAAVKW